ncbi:MAG: PSD1 and planctomycete cytochrome C domain-containing protein [Planctomycetaceae bacterium]
MLIRILRLPAAIVLAASTVSAADVDYVRDIKPLLSEKCGSCHGAVTQEAGLRFDAGTLIQKGGDSGPVILTTQPDQSLLIQRVTTEDPVLRMPPKDAGDALTDAQVALLTEWLRNGAVFPDNEHIPAGPDSHWAYQLPVKVPIPGVIAEQTNPVDVLIQARLDVAGLTPLPRADKSTLLRRVYLDLIGLPPTREQRNEFLADDSRDAWPRLIDRLLADPAYGERWGRHWMDVWRYSDWDGYQNEVRGSQRHIWRWREWIIESLNEDKSYDRMIVEMLAGDEVAPEDPDTLRATGFLARSFHNSNRDIWLDAAVEHTAKAFLAMTVNCARCHDHKYDPIVQREYYGFRAIFEPHHVRTERVPGESDLMKSGIVRAYDKTPDAETWVYINGNEKQPDKEHPVAPALPSILDLPFEPQQVSLPAVAAFPALREFIRQEDFAAAENRLNTAQQKLSQYRAASPAEIADAENAVVPEIPELADAIVPRIPSEEDVLEQHVLAAETALAGLKARWAADVAKFSDADEGQRTQLAKDAAVAQQADKIQQARADALQKKHSLVEAHKSHEADAGKKQAAIAEAAKAYQQAAKAALDAGYGKSAEELPEPAEYTPVGETYPAVSTGRRLALAKWITHRRNPLTARVAVNHIWMRHFGEPLVANIFDFGLKTPRPSHAELLDWLAVEFMEHDYSMKHLHRLLLTSGAYCRASAGETALMAANDRVDPDNQIMWKSNVRRMEAELVRDSVLHVSGALDTTRGGPDLDFQDGESILRRSVYFRHAYEKQMTMLVIFDAAGPSECYRRSPSIIPQQALALSNSPLTFDASRRLASRIAAEAGDSEQGSQNAQEKTANTTGERYIRIAFQTVLGRSCTDDELQACTEFLATQSDRLSASDQLTPLPGTAKTTVSAATDPRQRARENLIHVLLNHNDFVTIR